MDATNGPNHFLQIKYLINSTTLEYTGSQVIVLPRAHSLLICLRPPNPPSHNLVYCFDTFSRARNLKPLPMLLPTCLAILLDSLLRQFQMYQPLHFMRVRDFVRRRRPARCL